MTARARPSYWARHPPPRGAAILVPELLAFLLAASLAAVHLLAGRLRVLDRLPRSRWLSFSGGLSVAYVFVHLLPELSAGQEVLATSAGPLLAAVETHVWLVALVGLSLFYGLERAAKRSQAAHGGGRGARRVFWLHIGSFALYNVLVGYLLQHRPDDDLAGLLLFWFAMLLHLLVNDDALHRHHRDAYARTGRWVVAAAVLGGWLLGWAFDVGEAAEVVLLAFLGGGVILNVLKEELPEERQSSFTAFAAGAAAYTALLLAS